VETENVLPSGLVTGTLQQFDNRFNFDETPFSPAASHGLFRTASQICEIHMLPRAIPGNPTITGGVPQQRLQPQDMINPNATSGFWAARRITGDNVKERLYTNLYAKLTTQSNTFRVFFKAQTIRKARSVGADRFNPSLDRVASEYRGSTLIERKLDPNDPRLPDYAQPGNALPLDSFYRFRVLETKRFAP
jgi:hypothetical protein